MEVRLCAQVLRPLHRRAILSTLLHEPDLVILDEPTSSLDPVGRKEFRDILLLLKSQGKTVFISSHILSEVESVCDRVAIMEKGELKRIGTLQELSAPKSVARWAQLDHCSPLTPATSYPSSSVKLTTYARCRDRVKVVLRTLIGGVHQWTNDIGQLVEGVLPPP